MDYDAVLLRSGHYAVRPLGRCGTCGWIGGKPWTVIYVKARNSADALRRAAIIRG